MENKYARFSDNRAIAMRSFLGEFRMPTPKKSQAILPKATTSKKAGADLRRSMPAEPSRVGKRGAVVIPAALRRRYGIEEGSFVVAEPCEGGILIRPALVLPVEVYTPERKAQFLLSNAIDAADYAGAVAEVARMGLDPADDPALQAPRGLTRGPGLPRRQRPAFSRLAPGRGIQRLWRLDGVQLLSSEYALDEALRNLETPAQRARLTRLRRQGASCRGRALHAAKRRPSARERLADPAGSD